MTLDQIKYLLNEPNVTIGAHGHSHCDIRAMPDLKQKINYLKNDTKEMLEWFHTHLNHLPTAFCFPYNEDVKGMYASLLKPFGFTQFYGKERIDIESLYGTTFS